VPGQLTSPCFVLGRRGATVLIGALVALGAWVEAAPAEEAKTPVSASMILSIFAQPVEPRVSAFDQALREDDRPRRAAECETQPDGAVRCGAGAGAVTVTVRNPCPPGTAHFEPPPLPGRRARN
jgi:hypothetical protein